MNVISPFSDLTQARLVNEAKKKRLHLRPEWLRLVHYRKKWISGWESEADQANFFVAPKGRTNPEAELQATIEGFFRTERRKLEFGSEKIPAMSVRCQFPARYAWLDRELGLSSIAPAQTCPEFEEFRARMAAKSATLVFSSYHVSGPSSAFGHTLIRLSKASKSSGEEHHQLLDHGINYAANPTTSNALLYAILGMTGGFPGTFTSLPYYYKVREYNDFESRDLWEYDLELTQEEVNQLVAHIWELGTTSFDYYYVSENCSYHMLTLIEAAAPRLELVSRIPFYVLPVDTVKALYQEPGLVREAHYRPSIHTQFKTRLERLSAAEQAELAELIRSKEPSSLKIKDPHSQAKVLDAYIDYIDLNNAHALIAKDEQVNKWKQSVLMARSRLPITGALEIRAPLEDNPSLSHGSTRFMAYRALSQNLGNATGFAIRYALHDPLDPSTGSPADSEVEFAQAQLRWWEDEKKLQLEDLVLFGVGTYAPLKKHERHPSWRVRVGAERVYDARCVNCFAAFVRGAGGATVELLSRPRLVAYLLAEGAVHGSAGFSEHQFTSMFGPTLGARVHLHPQASLLTEAKYFRTLSLPSFEGTRLESILRVAPSMAWAIEARAEFSREDREISLGMAHYF